MSLRAACGALVFACFFSANAYGGEACTDACSGNFGPDPCGAFGLGCPPGGGQCIVCRDDNDCQPGGNCVMQQCINLPCSPATDAGTADSLPGPGDAAQQDQGVPQCICDVDFGCSAGCPCDPQCTGDTGAADIGGDTDVLMSDVGFPEDASPGADAASSPRDGSGGGGAARDPREGCSCKTADRGTSSVLLWLALGIVALRRRERPLVGSRSRARG